jgi:hypothetical protein
VPLPVPLFSKRHGQGNRLVYGLFRNFLTDTDTD